jgi:hypothetical protein
LDAAEHARRELGQPLLEFTEHELAALERACAAADRGEKLGWLYDEELSGERRPSILVKISGEIRLCERQVVDLIWAHQFRCRRGEERAACLLGESAVASRKGCVMARIGLPKADAAGLYMWLLAQEEAAAASPGRMLSGQFGGEGPWSYDHVPARLEALRAGQPVNVPAEAEKRAWSRGHLSAAGDRWVR